MSAAPSEIPRRPLTIIELCLSDGCGGLEHYAAGLVPALRERGHRLIVVARDGNEFAKRAGLPPTLTLRHFRFLPWHGARKLARLARKADIIHIHRSADLPLAVMAKRRAKDRPALVYTRHMLITRNRKESSAHRYMFARVDRLITITEQLEAEAQRSLPIAPQRIQTLAPGVSPGARTADCARIRPPATDFVAGCFSRIEAAKGQHELIEAVAKLRATGVNIGAVFAGPVMDADYDAEIRRRVTELDLDGPIRFLDTLADARPAMACCDVVVMPSSGEALGLVLVEAMLMGVPAIGSAAGGVLEFVADGETGLTYPVGDVDALAERLRRLAADPEYAHTLARAGQRMASDRFDRERHLQRLEELLYNVAKERNPASRLTPHASR
ncbi:MAG: glycosyltransferase family 4 protein [Gammaproteobacteria bacterium]